MSNNKAEQATAFYVVGDEQIPKAVVESMRVVCNWMYHCMFTERTRWTYGNERDSMADCRNFMGVFLDCIEEE